MDLKDKINLIDQMIRENPDYTIRDYLDTIGEIENINPEKMNKPKLYTPEQGAWIIANGHKYTVRVIAQRLQLPEEVVRNFGARHRVAFLKQPYGCAPTEENVNARIPRVNKSPEKEGRPESVYSNSGFINTSRKYAS